MIRSSVELCLQGRVLCEHGGGILLLLLVQRGGEGRVSNREYLHSQKGGVGCTVDRDGSHGHAGGHLHGREQGVHTVEVLGQGIPIPGRLVRAAMAPAR